MSNPPSPPGAAPTEPPQGTIGTTKASKVSLSLDHPRLLQTDGESIRVFLRKYDQYSNAVKSRARQLSAYNATTEAVRPVELKFCVDPEYLESSIALVFIDGVESYENITD